MAKVGRRRIAATAAPRGLLAADADKRKAPATKGGPRGLVLPTGDRQPAYNQAPPWPKLDDATTATPLATARQLTRPYPTSPQPGKSHHANTPRATASPICSGPAILKVQVEISRRQPLPTPPATTGGLFLSHFNRLSRESRAAEALARAGCDPSRPVTVRSGEPHTDHTCSKRDRCDRQRDQCDRPVSPISPAIDQVQASRLKAIAFSSSARSRP